MVKWKCLRKRYIEIQKLGNIPCFFLASFITSTRKVHTIYCKASHQLGKVLKRTLPPVYMVHVLDKRYLGLKSYLMSTKRGRHRISITDLFTLSIVGRQYTNTSLTMSSLKVLGVQTKDFRTRKSLLIFVDPSAADSHYCMFRKYRDL